MDVFPVSHRMGGRFALLFFTLLAVGAVFGCVSAPENLSAGGGNPAETVSFSAENAESVNPLTVQTSDPGYLWESIIDVLDDYFPIEREYPVQSYRYVNDDRVESVVRTEGQVETKPVIAAGIFQPWKKNSITFDQRIEATFQTVRRFATVRVVPEESGFAVHLAVYNELENLPQPMQSGASGTNLLFNDDLSQLESPTGASAPADGWIPLGRDFDLEQYMLRQIAWRLKNPPETLNPQNAALPPATPTEPIVP